MRKSLISAVLAASFVATSALAAAQTETGAIKALNPTKHEITLANGMLFEVPAAWSFTGYKVGDKVKVTYEAQNGKMMASEVTHAS